MLRLINYKKKKKKVRLVLLLLSINLLITSQTLKRIAIFCGLCSAWESVAKFIVCYSVFTQHDERRCLCFDEV